MTAHDEKGKRFRLETPGRYRIQVEGHLEEKWSDRLGGMGVATAKLEGQRTVTTLVGRLRDQAELTGVLNSLYDMHMPILSVELVNEEETGL
jgi:hypothetical protein